MDKRRQERVNSEIKKIVANALSNMRDPKITAMTSVMDVNVSSDLSYCDIYFSIMGTSAEKTQVMETLENAKGYFKQHIAKNITLRVVPELRVHQDTTMDHAARVNELLNTIKKEEDNANESID
ncbi:MAG: 30S ribosome-binding factor RbfA [Tissierellia bacterium]|nr:30S ribosome-binding factor RbfA [Tissierellia bacterium]